MPDGRLTDDELYGDEEETPKVPKDTKNKCKPGRHCFNSTGKCVFCNIKEGEEPGWDIEKAKAEKEVRLKRQKMYKERNDKTWEEACNEFPYAS